MVEQMKRYYQKEEEFIEEFLDVTDAVTKILKDEWEPDYECDDETRRKRDYFLRSGELYSLVFDGAAVYDDENGFSSVQVILQSLKRVVTIRVAKINNGFEAEIIVDKNT